MADQGNILTPESSTPQPPEQRPSGNRNNRRRNNHRSSTPRFKGAIKTLAVLGTRAERQDKDQHIRFQEDL